MQGAFAKGAVGISLIKGIEFKDSKPILISDLLAAEMKKARPYLYTPYLHTPLALHPQLYTVRSTPLSTLQPLSTTPLSMLHPLSTLHAVSSNRHQRASPWPGPERARRGYVGAHGS